MKKYLKIKYVLSFFKIIIYKIFLKVDFMGYRYCIENGVKFKLSNNGIVRLNDKVYFSKNCEINSDKGVIEVGYNTFFNTNCKIVSLEKVMIGSNCIIGPNVLIYDHDHKYRDNKILICKQGFETGTVEIGSNVWIGGNVTITKNVNIGDRVVIGANSVVTSNLESNGVYAGNPAQLKRKI